MNTREAQLREQDVRKEAPPLNPRTFLALYLQSDFPQTSAFPSPRQKKLGMIPMDSAESVKSGKKPLSGTSFDNPAGS